MKTQLFAAAAVLALAVSAPAFAQNIGSVGAAVNYSDIDSKVVNARLPATWGRRSFRARSIVRRVRVNMYR